jgi:cation:H+ antiporter
MIQNVALLVVGLLLLYYCAGYLVRGASSLAKSLGLTPIVIGLTVVAFGTSAPELVVSVVSSVKNKSMIAVGNVIGSNICNIALVLGLASLLHPMRGHPSVNRRDIPIMLGVSLYLLLISLNSHIGRFEGFTLICGIVVYTWFNYHVAIKESQQRQDDDGMYLASAVKAKGYIPARTHQVLFILVGIAGVVAGAEMLIDSAVAIMTVLGVNEKFIGLTVVALGTSLPELATSVVAALKREMDISIGNLVGSNVFNILSVLGAASLVRPIPIPGGFIDSGLLIDYMVMMAISFLPWLMMRKTPVIGRKNGAVLLSCYAMYIVYLIIKT